MRELKFRAWDKKYKKLVPLTLLGLHNPHETDPPVYGVWDVENEEGVAHYSDVELMQYTGLKDKNGKEIYEGDVLASDEAVASDGQAPSAGYTEVRKVEEFTYFDGKKGTRYYGRRLQTVYWGNNGFEPFSDSAENCHCCGGAMNPGEFEVIGNIYENPELLK